MNVDLHSPEMTAAFRAAPVYRKSGIVAIRPASPGEVIQTTTSNGVNETRVTCAGGEPVITGPGGETYVPAGGWAQVGRRYTPLSDGTYQAKGMVRAFPNPTGQPVTILALWGEQSQDEDCQFATEYFADDPDRLGDNRYLIGGAEFRQTYAPAEGAWL